MNFVGVDLSLTSTGICSLGSPSIISTKSRGTERLFHISTQILNYCINIKSCFVLIEGYSFASRNSQAHSIGELGGCVRMKLWESGIGFVEIPPTCRAKFATGRGNAGKGEVISSISAKTGIVWSGSGADDMCDAWVLEEMGLAKVGKSKYDWPSNNMSALDRVDWSSLNEFIRKENH